jgi:hypothetical protein
VAASRSAASSSFSRYGSSGQRVAMAAAGPGKSARSRASEAASSGVGGVEPPATVRAWPIRLATASSPRSTWSAWMAMAALVVSAVTLGLPSRSPPTQLPQRR